MRKNRSCPVCGNNSVYVIKRIDLKLPPGYRLPDSYDVVTCEDCGMCYANTSATQSDYNYYYSHHNMYSGLHYENSMRLRIVELIQKYCNINTKILDMGCGNGELLHLLKKAGYHELVGIDPSFESVKMLSDIGIRSYVGSVLEEPIPFLKGQFGCCCLISVLEHLLYPGKAIDVLSGYLRHEDIIIFEIPDYSIAHKTDAPIPNMFNQEHINYFSIQSFSSLLALKGFKAIAIEPYCTTIEGIDSYSIIGVFKKDESICNSIEKDMTTSLSITKFINNQLKKETARNELISDFAENHSPIYIWGTGAFVSRLMMTADLSKCNIISFVDNNPIKQNTKIYNIKIISPFDIVDNSAPILVASMLYSNDICEQIKKMQIPNRIIPLMSL
jgi:SAM-dependent methyltransferase